MAAAGGLSPPDDESIIMFFGHSGIDCTREIVSESFKVAKMTKTALTSNILTVSFGLAGNTNSFTVQEAVAELCHTENKVWLYDPITYFDNILEYVNGKLAEEADDPVDMFLSMGSMLDFKGVPFSYVNNIEPGNHGRRPKNQVYTSGVYNLKTVAADSHEFSRIKDPDYKSPVHDVREIDELFSGALLPDVTKINRDTKTLSKWYKEFEKHMITTADLKSIAGSAPEKMHIFYLSACRVPEYSKNLAGMAAATRNSTIAEYGAMLAARKGEKKLTENIRGYVHPLSHAVRNATRRKSGSKKSSSSSRRANRKRSK
jgi:hypothetical protein